MEKYRLSQAEGIILFEKKADFLEDFLFLDVSTSSLEESVKKVKNLLKTPKELHEFLELLKVRGARSDYSLACISSQDLSKSLIENVIALDNLINRQQNLTISSQEFVVFFDRKSPENLYIPLLEGVCYELIQALLLLVLPPVAQIYKMVEDYQFSQARLRSQDERWICSSDLYKKTLNTMENQCKSYKFLFDEIYRIQSVLDFWNSLNQRYFAGKRRRAFAKDIIPASLLGNYFQLKEWGECIEFNTLNFFERVNKEVLSVAEINLLGPKEEVGSEDEELRERIQSLRDRISGSLGEQEREGVQKKDQEHLLEQKNSLYKTVLRILLRDFLVKVGVHS